MSNNALQEILSKRFSRYTHTTNPSVWEAIEAQLDDKKSNREAIWFWILNGLAASLLFGMIFIPNQKPLGLKFSSNLGIERIKKIIPIDGRNYTPTPSHQVAVTEQKNARNDYTNFTHANNGNGHKKQLKEIDLPKQISHESAPQLAQNSDPHFTPLLAPKSAQKIDQFVYFKSQLKETIASRIQPFRSSIWTEIQSSYLLGIRPNESSITTLDAAQKPSLNRGFEFTCMSHIELSRMFSLGIGIGYADASRQTTEQLVAASYALLKTDDYRQYNLVIPVQASYTLFAHRRFELNAGIVLQPEYAQLAVTSDFKVTSYASISGLESITSTESVTNLHKSFQFGIEPYAQASVSIHPRISINTSVGYRSYLKILTVEEHEHESRNNITFNLGVQYRLK